MKLFLLLFVDTSHCFFDTMPKDVGKAGNWKIKRDNTSNVCARYSFSALVDVYYPTMIGNVSIWNSYKF